MPILVRTWKYTGIVQSFIFDTLMENIFAEKNFSRMRLIRKIYRFAGNYFRERKKNIFLQELISWILLRFIFKRTYFRGRPILNKFSRRKSG